MPRKLLKKIRQRFGISAPRMMVKTHVAWYWRTLGLVVVLSCSFALAAWIYDAGRRFAGFDRSEAEVELSQLRETAGKLTQESAGLRASVNASESKLQIERAAQSQLGRSSRT
jgi:cell division protein FtsB